MPAVTDPRGIDFAVYRRLRQSDAMAALEHRTISALSAFGVLMTDTCINYQTVLAPLRGEHVAYGDTGSVIYANSVFGARSNFEGGPSALSAALTGRTPRYGYHLDEARRATRRFQLSAIPRELSEWGALGGIVGEACGSYWQVPMIEGLNAVPASDELKHFGAALASFGSVALFHIPGITAEDAVFAGALPEPDPVGRADIAAFLARYAAPGDKLDVVVFAAPQLSLFRDGRGGGRPPRAAGPSRHHGDHRDLARDQIRRRPNGLDGSHPVVRRDRRARDLLLPELCARDG